MQRRASRQQRQRWIRSAAICSIPFFSSRIGASPWGAAGWGRKWSPGRGVAAAHALPPRATVQWMDLGMLRLGGVLDFPRTSSPSFHRRRPRVLSRHASHLPAPCPTHLTPLQPPVTGQQVAHGVLPSSHNDEQANHVSKAKPTELKEILWCEEN